MAPTLFTSSARNPLTLLDFKITNFFASRFLAHVEQLLNRRYRVVRLVVCQDFVRLDHDESGHLNFRTEFQG